MEIWSSIDGVKWVNETISDVSLYTRYGHTVTVYEEELIMIGGFTNSTNWNIMRKDNTDALIEGNF